MVQVNKFDDALIERASKGTKQFLERQQGYEILEDNFKGFVVAKDTGRDALVFIRIFIAETDFYEKSDRPKFERAMLGWVAKHGKIDSRVRCDHISLVVFTDTNEIAVRHHINALGDMD